jgi:AAA domain
MNDDPKVNADDDDELDRGIDDEPSLGILTGAALTDYLSHFPERTPEEVAQMWAAYEKRANADFNVWMTVNKDVLDRLDEEAGDDPDANIFGQKVFEADEETGRPAAYFTYFNGGTLAWNEPDGPRELLDIEGAKERGWISWAPERGYFLYEPDAPEVDSWTVIDLLSFPYALPVRPTLGGVLYPGGRHIFSGEPESGKTIYLCHLGLQAIRETGKPVLHIDYEMYSARTLALLRDLGATDYEIALWMHVEPEGPPAVGQIEALLGRAPALVIVDAAIGAYDAFGLDDNKRADVERFSRLMVAPVHRAGVASVLVDHVTKNKETRGRYAIGSERKIGATDVHLVFDAIRPIVRGGTGLVKIAVAKDRFGYLPRPLGELRLESDPKTNALTLDLSSTQGAATDAHAFKPTFLMERVSEWLVAQGKPVSRSAVETAKLGKRVSYIREALDALVADGYVVETTGYHGSRAYASVKPFLESEVVRGRPSSSGTTSEVVPSSPSLEGTTDELDPDEIERLAKLADLYLDV